MIVCLSVEAPVTQQTMYVMYRSRGRGVQRIFLLACLTGHNRDALLHKASAFPREPGLQLQGRHQAGRH